MIPDTADPDVDDESNTGFEERKQLFLSDTTRPKHVVLGGYLMSNIRGLNLPIPSDCKVTVRLTRNLDELLITQLKNDANDLFRLRIRDIELQLPRLGVIKVHRDTSSLIF